MPKTEPVSDLKNSVKSPAKSIVKKSKPKVSDLESAEIKIESYVPKITHFTKAKKDSADMILESEQNPSQSLETITEPNQKNFTKSKLDTLKKEYKPAESLKLEIESVKKEMIEEPEQINQNLNLSKDEIGLNIQKEPKSDFSNSNLGFGSFKKSIGLPSFLNRASRSVTPTLENQTLVSNQKMQNPGTSSHTSESHNSLASIFTRDKNEIANIKRVFRKSIMFLTIALLSFGLTSLASSNFVLQSILAMVFTGFGFIALTNIFFIIVAHRTYVWLFLLGQFIILSITQYPHSTNLSTLIVGLVMVLLTYLAYLDLEKVQLGSRLFSIPYIVGESTKILSTVIIFIICLSSFNQIEARGVDKFIGESVLNIPQVMNTIVVPTYQNIYLRSSNIDFSQNSDITVKNLVCAERKLGCDTKNSTVLNSDELLKIQNTCKTDAIGDSGCTALIDQAQTIVLDGYKNQDFAGLGLTLGTKIDASNKQVIFRQLIQSKIKKQADSLKLSFLPSYIPIKSVIPFIVSLALFVLLSIFKFILVWIGYVVTWIFWKLLQITGFVRLDIEMVEAEIVGI